MGPNEVLCPQPARVIQTPSGIFKYRCCSIDIECNCSARLYISRGVYSREWLSRSKRTQYIFHNVLAREQMLAI